MALDMLVKFDGDKVKGESAIKDFKDAIDILAWSWGASQSGTMHHATGGGAGKANVQDLSFTKHQDIASVGLLQCCLVGEHFNKVTLSMRKAGGKDNAGFVFYTIEMEKVIVTSYSTGGSGGEDRLTENVTLNFAKVKVEYKSQDDKGKAGPSGKTTFDIAKGVLA